MKIKQQLKNMANDIMVSSLFNSGGTINIEQAESEVYIIRRDTIYFLDNGKLTKLRIFTNKYGEYIEALGYGIDDYGRWYYQHRFDRYDKQFNILKHDRN